MNIVDSKSFDLITHLSTSTQLPRQQIELIINKAPVTYILYKIPKKNGGTRYLYQPAIQTKMLQYIIMSTVFAEFKLSQVVYSYVKGLKSPLKKHAKLHAPYSYSIHLDFSNFFPSITADMFFKALEKEYGKSFSSDNQEVVKKVCFFKKKDKFSLVIGSPSSPIISNIFMTTADKHFRQYAEANDGKYSRYADDLWFSSNDIRSCIAFRAVVESFISSISYYNGLRLNHAKTTILHNRAPRKITGLNVWKRANHVTVPRSIKRITRSLIYKLAQVEKKQRLMDPDEANAMRKRLRGYINFIKDNEPSYLNSLIKKYHNDYHIALGYRRSG